MSEVKLNLTDARQTIHGSVHGSVAEALVAALSAEPETIAELEAALDRYQKPDEHGHFAHLSKGSEIDEEPWDAGIVVIDLAGRIVASDSTYSTFGREGKVRCHNGQYATDISVPYRLSADWLVLRSMLEYKAQCRSRREDRAANPPLDTRAVLFGRPLLEWIILNVRERVPFITDRLNSQRETVSREISAEAQSYDPYHEELRQKISNELSQIHARWLMTPRNDLRGMTPREVLFAKQDFIDRDLESRSLQWSLQGEGPPCLAKDSLAYRFAGIGTHEWVIYYDLVRYLLWKTLNTQTADGGGLSPVTDIEIEIASLERFKTSWLEQPQEEYCNRTPANLIESERKRLPIALTPREMIIDDDCPACQMLADDTDSGPGFWHLDGSHMEDEFAFSWVSTLEEWEAEQVTRKEFDEKFKREWAERQQRIARGEQVESVTETEGPF